MTSFRLLLKLVVSQIRLHPGRALVTTCGIIASTCAVVWVVSGYDALVSQFDENAGKYLGRYDALVMPVAGGPAVASNPAIDDALIKALQQDAGVLEVNPVSNSRVSATRVQRGSAEQDSDDEDSQSSLGLLIGDRPPVNGAPPVGPTLVSTPAAEAPYELVDGQWLGHQSKEEAVVGENVAAEMNLSVGDDVRVTTFGNQVQLRIVGIIEQAPETPSFGEGGKGRGRPSARSLSADRPSARRLSAGRPSPGRPTSESDDPSAEMTPATRSTAPIGLPSGFTQGVAGNAIYVRPKTAARINGYETKPQVLQIAVRDAVTIDQFREVWAEKLAAHQPPLQLIDFSRVRIGLESSGTVSGQQSQAWAATGMASLAAIFIIFSTLSMGVSERAREFAMLRAIALTRSQLACIIAIESVVLAVIGWAGGLLVGWIMILVGSRLLPSLFSSGAVIGWGSVLLTGVTVLVGAIGAAILPAWRAMRIQPLDAMTNNTGSRGTGATTQSERFGYAGTGLIGLLLIALTPVIVFLLPMADSWKTWTYSFVAYPVLLVGMILLAPVMVNLCERALAPLVNRLLRLDPRILKTQLSSNLWRSVGATLALSVGLGLYASTQTWGYSMLIPFTPGDWLPDALVAFHPVGIDEADEAFVRQVEGVKADEVMPLAIEQAKFDWGAQGQPERLRLGGDNAVVCGLDPKQAFGGKQPMLPVEFVAGDRDSAINALASGDACVIAEDFSMATGLGLGDTVTFIPPANEREKISYKIAAVVSLPGWQWVTKFSGVRRHFVRTGTIMFAGHDHVRKHFQLQRTEFFWVNFDRPANLNNIEAAFQSIAERHAGETFTATGVGEVKSYRPFARMTATENVKKAIKMRADEMIWGMSYLPLITLVVMSLAVVNTIIASVRSRTWEFGVMRSIGVTRGQLVRLVIAETVLIALAACVLSLTFGLVAGWCGVGMAQFGRWFAGPPSFLIPWQQLSFGFALTLSLCLLAGLWPAIRTGRAEPLSLLKAGRATQ